MIAIIVYFGMVGILCGLFTRNSEFKQESAIVYTLDTIMTVCFIVVLLCSTGIITEVK